MKLMQNHAAATGHYRRIIGALSALFALPLLLSACNGEPQTPQKPPYTLEGAAIGGSFTLLDSRAKPVNERDFAGKYRILYFGYTFCPDVCPVDLAKLMQGFKLFEKSHPALAAKVQPIFITIDPERDTPAVVGAYSSAFHPRLIGLTGSSQAIAAVAKAHAIYFSRIEPDGKAGSSSEYLMDHSRQAYLMDPDGKPLELLSVDKLPNSRPSTPADIAAELAQWVR